MVGHGYWCRWVDIVILWQSIFLFLSLDRAEAPWLCLERGDGADITRDEEHNYDKQGVMKKTDSRDDFNFMIFHPIHFKMPRMFVDWMGWISLFGAFYRFCKFLSWTVFNIRIIGSILRNFWRNWHLPSVEQRPPAAWTDKHCLVSLSGEDVKKLGLELQTIHRFSQSRRRPLCYNCVNVQISHLLTVFRRLSGLFSIVP